MITSFFIVILLIIWAKIWYNLCLGIFKKIEKFKSLPASVTDNLRYKPFIRTDLDRFSKKRFFLIGFFKVPIVFSIIVMLHFIALVYLQLISFIFPLLEKGIHNYPKVHLSLLLVQGFLGWIVIFLQGITVIENKIIDFDLTNYPMLKIVKDEPCKTVCSNHVSHLDILVYFTHMSCAFIAKKEV